MVFTLVLELHSCNFCLEVNVRNYGSWTWNVIMEIVTLTPLNNVARGHIVASYIENLSRVGN